MLLQQAEDLLGDRPPMRARPLAQGFINLLWNVFDVQSWHRDSLGKS